MKRIYLSCSTGMLIGMLVNRMQGIANPHDLPIEVETFPDGGIGQITDEKHPDVIFLGPRVKYRYGEIAEKYGDKGIPIQVIGRTDYGMVNSEKVLKSAIKPMKSAK